MNGDLVGVNAQSRCGSAETRTAPSTDRSAWGSPFPSITPRASQRLITTGRASHAWLGAQVSGDADPHGAKGRSGGER